ncbi:MAG TPA: S53 family peptidase [Solirubrobacteraceae bacterium]|nr:S53 family peptidase [Solirubrobacteraceae bacterium]
MAAQSSIGRGARRAVHAAIVACSVSASGLVLASTAVASAPSAPVAQRAHITVTLRPRDPAALAREVRAVSTPGSPSYRHYLAPRAFGARYGARPATIASVTRALRAHGLAPGPASAGGLSIPLTVPAAALAHAGAAVGDTTRALVLGALPRSTRASVEAVIAFGRRSAARPLALRDPTHRGALTSPLNAGLGARSAAAVHGVSASTATGASGAPGPQPCAAASAAAAAVHATTEPTIASAYGFDALYAAGDEGQGVTVAVYELEPNDPADVAAFQACYRTHAAVSYVRVDGGAGSGAGSDEAALDIENLIGLAPRVHVLVYQGPNARSGLPGSGPYDVFSAIVNQDRARVVSVSWGQCEAQLGSAAQQAESVLFEQAAVQGQTIVAAAGDNGSEDCDTGGPNSSTGLAVDDPASQPEVVGVGGTTLLAAGPPPSETVWNSGPGGPGAGGGGVSDWPMGPDQLDTPGFLHVRRAAARAPACNVPRGHYCREVPDVSANADPATGYEVYWNGADTVPEPSGWQALGGTSAAAPVWAALFALADASPACASRPLGFAGPALYRAAAGDYRGDFHDVTSGGNDLTGGNGGRWPAGPGYDLASGLGTPDAAPLARDLCDDSLALSRVRGQSSALGAAVAVALHGRDVRGARLRYTARGLPPGVRIGHRNGRLTGRPRRPGRYRVHVAVRDGRGARAGRTFAWTVGALPRVTLARVTGAGGNRRLALTIASGRHAPWLRRIRVRLPAGFAARRHPHAIVHARHRASLRVAGSAVTITLSAPCPSVRVSLRVRDLGRGSDVRVAVGVRAGSTGTSVLRAPLGSGR